MTTLEQAARQALGALEVATTPLAKDRQEVLRAIITLREALSGVQALSAAPTTSFEKVLSAYLTEDGFIAADDIPSICNDFARLLVVMKSAVRWAPSSAYWSEQLRRYFGEDARDGIEALEAQLRAALAASPTPPAEQQAAYKAVPAPLSDDDLVELGKSEKSGLHPWGIGTTRADYLRAVRAVLDAARKQGDTP